MIDREMVLRRFQAWLDRALAEESAPEGIAAEVLSALETEADHPGERRSDQYSMWAAIIALTQEVKLQGRSFKQLSDTLAPVADLIPRVDSVLDAHREALDAAGRMADQQGATSALRDREIRDEAEDQTRREVIDALLDLRDRLGRGFESLEADGAAISEALQPRWMDALVPRRRSTLQQALRSLAAMQNGYALSVERLDELLEQYEVREIDCQGENFDPRSMKAIEREETNDVPQGTVVKVYRAGYEWNGEVYRAAEVKVACPPGGFGRAARKDLEDLEDLQD